MGVCVSPCVHGTSILQSWNNCPIYPIFPSPPVLYVRHKCSTTSLGGHPLVGVIRIEFPRHLSGHQTLHCIPVGTILCKNYVRQNLNVRHNGLKIGHSVLSCVIYLKSKSPRNYRHWCFIQTNPLTNKHKKNSLTLCHAPRNSCLWSGLFKYAW